jgi:type IV secretory pathway VirJ component
MKHFLFLSILSLIMLCKPALAAMQERTDNYGPFGTLHLYQTIERPKNVVLFLSGDGGWNLGVVDMARSLAELDSLVVGIDTTHYIKSLNSSSEKCNYSAAHLEGLSQYIQKKYGFSNYKTPVLVGYSSGATLVYSTLAQSPANTFAGGISLGFCPDLKTDKAFCKGSGALMNTPNKRLGFIYQPVKALLSPWVVLQGDVDQVCSTPDAKKFVSTIGRAELLALPKVGHGFSIQKNWMPQFKEAFTRMTLAQQASTPRPKAASIKDLPLVELPTTKASDTLAVIVTGDGGWASIDKQIGEALVRDGIPVVGLNSLQYFWQKKSPDGAAKDLTRILEYYSNAWGKKKFLLVGYSRGADVLPFMISRLSDDLKARVATVALLGLEEDVDFEFNVTDWLGSGGNGEHKTVPEIAKLKGIKLMCIYGAEEKTSACRKLDRRIFNVVEVAGGHHFDGDYDKLATLILNQHKQ